MRYLLMVCAFIGFMTAAVAVGTAENASGEKFWMCVVVGTAGLVLMGISILLLKIFYGNHFYNAD